jgi:hypothetical protein
MQSQVRSHLAAVLLLAPLAATMVATPAFAERAVVAPGVARGAEPSQGRPGRGADIRNVSPADGSRVVERDRTTISARLSDDGRGVDPRAVTLRVDGRDVTRNARIDGNEINYRDDLGRGRHTAELTVRDRAGNTTRRAWSFEVIDQRDDNRANGSVQPGIAPSGATGIYPGTLPVQVTSHVNGTVVDLVNQPVVLHGRTAPNSDIIVVVEVNLASPAGATSVQLPDGKARSDGGGNFTVVIDRANQVFPVTSYDLRVHVTNGPYAADQRLSLRQRF